jgi:hypothetical protein
LRPPTPPRTIRSLEEFCGSDQQGLMKIRAIG